ncbi:hypothetical protein BDV3_006810 [Batrachochytrium dendrobatidis]|nr:hypothetical protein QVD99_007408 [Batrachochytrium dendrobatidis]
MHLYSLQLNLNLNLDRSIAHSRSKLCIFDSTTLVTLTTRSYLPFTPPSLDSPLHSFPCPSVLIQDSRITHKTGSSDWRLGPIAVFWYDFITVDMDPDLDQSADLGVDLGVDNPSSDVPLQQSHSVLSDAADHSQHRVLTSGVFVPVASPSEGASLGVLHLYKDKNDVMQYLQLDPPSAESASQVSPSDDQFNQLLHVLGSIVAVLAVPPHIIPQEFLKLMGACRKSMSHLRIIKDSVPNRFIMLLKFRSARAAYRFYDNFNGRSFNSFEPEICHVVFIKSVEFDSPDIPKYAFSPASPDPALLLNSESCTLPNTITNSQSIQNNLSPLLSDPQKSSSLLELPTCPVCLDRMDSSVTGLLTIVCHHTFHCSCIMKWGDSTCPVCRYSSTKESDSLHPSSSPLNECSDCASTENLWICLICGSIGCGRYFQGHAFKHYQETGHVYALELETQRVWDYAGDGYVHRLIQNRTDGKLVELPAPSSSLHSSINGLTPHSNVLGPVSASPYFAADGSVPSSSAGYISHVLGRRAMGLDTLDPHSIITVQDAAIAEKVDALGLEYSHMLQSQLDTQRKWFERQLTKIENASVEHISFLDQNLDTLREAYRQTCAERDSLLSVVNQHVREKKQTDRKMEQLCDRLGALERDTREEQALNSGLQDNLVKLRADLEASLHAGCKKDALISELQEQVRDVMFYVETLQKVDSGPLADELKHATVVGVADAPIPSGSNSSIHRRQKGKRK